MGSACHYNYIHVTEDGVPDSNAKTGGRGTAMPAETSTAQTTASVQNNVSATENTTVTSAATTAKNSANPVSPANTSAAKAVTVSAVQNVSTTAYANEYHEEVVVYAAAAVSDHTSNPETGADSVALWLLLAGSLGTAFLTKKRK
jgi:hypothetical protein